MGAIELGHRSTSRMERPKGGGGGCSIYSIPMEPTPYRFANLEYEDQSGFEMVEHPGGGGLTGL